MAPLFCVEEAAFLSLELTFLSFELVFLELELFALDVPWFELSSSGWEANVEVVTVTLASPELSRSTLGLSDKVDMPSSSLWSSVKLMRAVLEGAIDIALCDSTLSVPVRCDGLGRALTVESVEPEAYDLMVFEALCRSEGGFDTGWLPVPVPPSPAVWLFSFLLLLRSLQKTSIAFIYKSF